VTDAAVIHFQLSSPYTTGLQRLSISPLTQTVGHVLTDINEQ